GAVGPQATWLTPTTSTRTTTGGALEALAASGSSPLPPQSQKTIAMPAMIQVGIRGDWLWVRRSFFAMTSSSPTEKVLDDCSVPRRAQRKRALAVAKLHVDAG